MAQSDIKPWKRRYGTSQSIVLSQDVAWSGGSFVPNAAGTGVVPNAIFIGGNTNVVIVGKLFSANADSTWDLSPGWHPMRFQSLTQSGSGTITLVKVGWGG